MSNDKTLKQIDQFLRSSYYYKDLLNPRIIHIKDITNDGLTKIEENGDVFILKSLHKPVDIYQIRRYKSYIYRLVFNIQEFKDTHYYINEFDKMVEDVIFKLNKLNPELIFSTDLTSIKRPGNIEGVVRQLENPDKFEIRLFLLDAVSDQLKNER
jgi:hypothetical protein